MKKFEKNSTCNEEEVIDRKIFTKIQKTDLSKQDDLSSLTSYLSKHTNLNFSFSSSFGSNNDKISQQQQRLNINDIEKICIALKNNGTVKMINFAGQKIGNKGCKIIGNVLLTENKCLEKINLRYNEISDDGIEWVWKSLLKNMYLRKIDLGYNQIQGNHHMSKGIIGDVLSIREVDLYGNNIKGDSRLLKWIFEHWKGLTSLNLGCNKIDNIKLICKKLLQSSVSWLDLTGNDIELADEQDIDLLTNLIELNDSLAILKLDGNDKIDDNMCIHLSHALEKREKNNKPLIRIFIDNQTLKNQWIKYKKKVQIFIVDLDIGFLERHFLQNYDNIFHIIIKSNLKNEMKLLVKCLRKDKPFYLKYLKRYLINERDENHLTPLELAKNLDCKWFLELFFEDERKEIDVKIKKSDILLKLFTDLNYFDILSDDNHILKTIDEYKKMCLDEKLKVLSECTNQLQRLCLLNSQYFLELEEWVKLFIMLSNVVTSNIAEDEKKGITVSGKINVISGQYEGNVKVMRKQKSTLMLKKKYFVSYYGKYFNNKKNGVGRLFSQKRELLFYGHFRDDKKSGFGIEYEKAGGDIKRKGEWKNDKFFKEFKLHSIREYNMDNFKKNVYFGGHQNDFKLGEGAFSEVFIIDGIYAFKRFKVSNFNKKYAEREIQILSNVSHSNIINIIGVSWEKDLIGFVTDLCDKSIDTMIYDSMKKNEGKKNKNYQYYIPLQEKIRIILRIAIAMEYLHAEKIIHRDLKCDNVFLSHPPQRVVKIGDFGLSKFNSLTSCHTQGVIGTPGFIAPEIVRGRFDSKSYSFPCDVFSFSMIMYEIVFEKTVVRAINDQRKLDDKVYGMDIAYSMSDKKENLRPPIPVNTNFNQWIIRLIQSCWVDTPKLRPTFTDIIQTITDNISGKPFEKYVLQERTVDKEALKKLNLSKIESSNEIIKLKQLVDEKDQIIKEQKKIIDEKDQLIKEKDELIKRLLKKENK